VAQLLGATPESLYEGQAASLRAIAAAGGDGFRLRDRALHVYSEAARVWAFKATCDDGALGPEQKLAALGALMDGSHSSCAGLFSCSCEELDELVAAAREAGALGSRLTGEAAGSPVLPALLTRSQAPSLPSPLGLQRVPAAGQAAAAAAGRHGPCWHARASCLRRRRLPGRPRLPVPLAAGAGWGGCTVSLVREGEVDAFIAALKRSFYASRLADGTIGETDLADALFASPPSMGAAVLKL
jgi:galactokinase